MKILMTGSEGIIGTILRTEVPEYAYVRFDLPQYDARDAGALLGAAGECDALIHLAWNTTTEHWMSGTIDPDNARMTFNAYQVALEARIPRVIMASSVHADDYSTWREGDPLISAQRIPTPDSPYGASKVFMEGLGRFYAAKGLEVVCIRFMGLNRAGVPSNDPAERRRWFSHRDCGSLIKAILDARRVPGNFSLVYGCSDNKDRMHDLANPFDWTPQDSA